MVDDPAFCETSETRQHEPLSALVRRMEKTLPEGESITIGQFLCFLGVHGFVFFILVLALLNVFIFMLPGLSILFGVPMVILAVQMVLGLPAPIFPNFVQKQKLKGAYLHKGLDLAAQALEKIEPFIKPRILVLTSQGAARVHSVVALLLALMVAIPMPLLNLPPSFGAILLAIGLMQRDGVFVLCAYFFAGWSFWLYESLGRAAGSLF